MIKMLTASKVEKLKKRSDNVVSVFTQTVSDLLIINEDIETEKAARKTEMTRLHVLVLSEKEKVESLTSQAESNQKVIDKVTEFLA